MIDGVREYIIENCSNAVQKKRKGYALKLDGNIFYFPSYDDAINKLVEYTIDNIYKIIKENNLESRNYKFYEGKYIVFDSGNILSLKNLKFIGNYTDSDGYPQITVRYKGCGKKYNRPRIHRIVAELFIPNPNNLPQVNHIDGNKKNNSIENLEWVTNKDNCIHAYKTGLNHGYVLSKEETKYIADNYLARDPVFGSVALSKRFGVSATHITKIARNARKQDEQN